MSDEEGINLDGQNHDDLWAFWKETNSVRPVKKARQLFPSRPTGYVTATKQLGNYACNKAVAMKCRGEGQIQAALTYETICENIYKALPQFAKW